MGRIKENNWWKCRACGIASLEPELLKAPSPFNSDDELVACPRCLQCSEGFDLLCDEPGCNKHAGCGWPTGDDNDEWGGYRDTCAKHMLRIAEEITVEYATEDGMKIKRRFKPDEINEARMFVFIMQRRGIEVTTNLPPKESENE